MKTILLMSTFICLCIGFVRLHPVEAIQSIESVRQDFYNGRITRSEVYHYCYDTYENNQQWLECVQYFGL